MTPRPRCHSPPRQDSPGDKSNKSRRPPPPVRGGFVICSYLKIKNIPLRDRWPQTAAIARRRRYDFCPHGSDRSDRLATQPGRQPAKERSVSFLLRIAVTRSPREAKLPAQRVLATVGPMAARRFSASS
jgi:hypothetical protein